MIHVPKRGPLSDAQRRAITTDILYMSYLYLRSPRTPLDTTDVESLQWALRRSVAFGEALHNLPLYLYSDSFDFGYQKICLEGEIENAEEMGQFARRLGEIQLGDVESRW